MTFELMKACHIPDIAAIEREAMAEPWSENMLAAELENPSSCVIVGVLDGRVVCYGGFRQALDEADILNVAVRKDLRGQGIGKRLMAALLDEAKRRGIRRLTLEVSEKNVAATALYSGYGFKRVGVRKRYYENRFDALIMRLELEEGLDSN